MDTNTTRIKNLRRLIAEKTKTGKIVEFADQYSLDPAQLSGLLNGHRSIGEKLARKIESAAGARTGYLDESPGALTLREPHAPDYLAPPTPWVIDWSQLQRGEPPTKAFRVRLPNDHGLAGIPTAAEALVDPEHTSNGSTVIALHLPSKTAGVYNAARVGGALYLSHPSGKYPPQETDENWQIIGPIRRILLTES